MNVEKIISEIKGTFWQWNTEMLAISLRHPERGYVDYLEKYIQEVIQKTNASYENARKAISLLVDEKMAKIAEYYTNNVTGC